MFGKLRTKGIQWLQKESPEKDSFEKLEEILKGIDPSCSFEDDMKANYFNDHPKLKKIL